MRTALCAAVLTLTALALTSCGGEHLNPIIDNPSATIEVLPFQSVNVGTPSPPLPRLLPREVVLAPISYRGIDGKTLMVGNDLTPRYPLQRWDWGPDRPSLFYGSQRSPLHYSEIFEYLEQATGGKLTTFSSPPTVHIGRAGPHRQNILRAVQWLNEALPPAWHMRIGKDVAPLSRHVPSGAIYVDVAPSSAIRHKLGKHAAGTAHPFDNADGSRRAAHVFVAPDRMGWEADDPIDDLTLDRVIVHELLHALAFWSHVEGQGIGSTLKESVAGNPDPTTILFPIDQQALFAAYVHMEPGFDLDQMYEALFWHWHGAGDVFVLRTELYEAGVSRQFISFADDGPAYLRGWASGPAPLENLADSPLSGTVTWNGELIGVRPGYHHNLGRPFSTVTGTAEISVELRTLKGHALFDDLKSHGPMVPNTGGATKRWGDGDLKYDIAVRGNTFHRVAGDKGVLTGIFTGERHEGTAGTLERDDLTAAFGGIRD